MTWPTKKLGEIAETSSGGTPRAVIREYWDGDIPWLRSGELIDGEIYKTEKMITERGLKESSAKMFPKNSVLIALTGATVGRTGILRINSATNQSVVGIFPNEKQFAPEFIWYFLRLNYPKIKAKAYGGAQPHIDQGDVQNLKIPFPPLEIQKQIVERLDKIAEAQKLNDDLIQKSDELSQSLLHQELNPAGKDWEVKKLDEIAKIIMGQSPPSTSYNESGNGLPFFQGKADFGDLYPNTVKYCSAPSRVAEPEDILISVRAPVGDINLAKNKSCIGRGLAAIRGNNKIVVQMLLYFLFRKNEKNWQKQSTGSTFAAITKDKLTNYKISLPPLETQKKIVAKLSAVQNYKNQLLAQKSKFKELFDSVLAKSMAGSLDK